MSGGRRGAPGSDAGEPSSRGAADVNRRDWAGVSEGGPRRPGRVRHGRACDSWVRRTRIAHIFVTHHVAFITHVRSTQTWPPLAESAVIHTESATLPAGREACNASANVWPVKIHTAWASPFSVNRRRNHAATKPNSRVTRLCEQDATCE